MMEPKLYEFAITLVFFAGVAYAGFNYRLKAVERSIRGNVNGLGAKTNKIVMYLTESAQDEKKRERLTDLFK